MLKARVSRRLFWFELVITFASRLDEKNHSLHMKLYTFSDTHEFLYFLRGSKKSYYRQLLMQRKRQNRDF